MDHVSKSKRSAIMRGIRRSHTEPELVVRSAAHRIGLRFRLHRSDLPGKPDIVLPRWRTVVFVHGCFWHGHKGCVRSRIPKSNVKFWQEKFARNSARDKRNLVALQKAGWRVLIIWQCQARTVDEASAALRPFFRRKPRC